MRRAGTEALCVDGRITAWALSISSSYSPACADSSWVLGGLLLFYKGIITLQQVSDKPDAVTFEFQRVLKIQSRYPAYGFFIFGLAFITLAAFYGRPDPQPTITLSGSGRP